MVTSKTVANDEQDRDGKLAHFDTPTRARVRAITEFCQAYPDQVRVSQNEIFRHCGVSKPTGYRMLDSLTSDPVRRHHNRANETETRGRKPIFGAGEWDILEDFILEGGFEGRCCGYMEIVNEVLPHVLKEHPKLSIKTVRKAFEDRGYSKCTACQKAWLTKQSLEQRFELLEKRRRWTKAQWRKVRFTDEFHVGQGPKRKLKIIRQRGERYCKDCIQKNANAKQMKNRNLSRFHFWISIGWNHKTIIEYTTPSSNGKMTQAVYLDTVLKGPVQKWLDNNESFLLEEDQDSGHGTSTSNLVRTWKEDNNVDYYFNASGSPDLSPAENVIRAIKQCIQAFDHFDDDTLHCAVFRAWDSVSQTTINSYIDSMPERMRELSKMDGEMTKY
jgi:hypothetical protein